MIIKQQPEDFVVEELTQVVPVDRGDFALYRLEKRGWTTPDALQAVRRRWKIDLRRVSCGGLKDRHAHTVQHLTILRGPRRQLTHSGIHVTYLGQVEEPFTSKHIQANRFRLAVRDMTTEEVSQAQVALKEVAEAGVPNYFDDQRFSSVAGHGEFLAKAIMLEEYERALHLALTAPYAHDRSDRKKEKSILRSHWGDWERARAKLSPRSHARSLVDYLARSSGDFRGALDRLQPELRGLFLSVYQSHLWNRMLALWLRTHLPAKQLCDVLLSLGDYPMQRSLTPEQKLTLSDLVLPLPGSRMVWNPDDPRQAIFEQILAEENIQLEQFKLKGMREMFFSRGERPALCMPNNMKYEVDADETHPPRQK